jgi:hypothetical protein
MKISPEYWQAVRRFGLPFGAVFLSLDYFVLGATNRGVRYSWGWHIVEDVLTVFFVSALWYFLYSKHKTH